MPALNHNQKGAAAHHHPTLHTVRLPHPAALSTTFTATPQRKAETYNSYKQSISYHSRRHPRNLALSALALDPPPSRATRTLREGGGAVEAEPAGGSVGSNVPVVRNGTRIVAVANQKGGVGSAGGARDPCFARHNTSERDLAHALKRVSEYVTARADEAPSVTVLRPEPAQNPHNRVSGKAANGRNREWRRAESNRGPRDYETLALAY